MTSGRNSLSSISKLKGVGPKVSESLLRLNIQTIEDALFHLPYRYEDRTKITHVADALEGVTGLFQGEITSCQVVFRGRRMLIVELYDGTGSFKIRMFHFAMAQKNNLSIGKIVRCYGTLHHRPNGKELIHPTYQVFNKDHIPNIENSFTPIYPTTDNLKQGRLRNLIRNGLSYAQKYNLLNQHWETKKFTQYGSILDALSFIHNPPADTDIGILSLGKHPAQRQLIYQELIAHMLCSGILKKENDARNGPALPLNSKKEDSFLNKLGFNLTSSQKNSWSEILNDLKGKSPMRRLLQGDVGSGKTVVGALAALHASENKFQTALMCPTEILAEQHHANLANWFNDLGIKVSLLTGSTTSVKRKQIVKKLYQGDIDILIGTHALFQPDVIFHKLGLTLIDEQQRFGVHQRFSLLQKGGSKENSSHQLIMTATPIPRTLAMTVYGSLEVSTIDEMPPGRIPIETSARPNSMRDKISKRIQEVCGEGQKVYWVCTLIDESEELEAQSAEDLFKELLMTLPEIKIGLVHGKLKKKEKDQVINNFRDGKIQLLVCTTVIEVGVDVPEANLMIIENAERLGLSQLHQLRGRVGRKANSRSHCLLLYKEPLSVIAKERIEIMETNNDGFAIAEKDLELRGAGEIYGTRQSGMMDLKIADPIRDSELLEQAQIEAIEMSKNNSKLAYLLVDRWVGKVVDYSDS
tara:strand:- start:18180 stop:20264 length:2085 start_codon:yes stop_codon:yes gene_type:complete